MHACAHRQDRDEEDENEIGTTHLGPKTINTLVFTVRLDQIRIRLVDGYFTIELHV